MIMCVCVSVCIFLSSVVVSAVSALYRVKQRRVALVLRWVTIIGHAVTALYLGKVHTTYIGLARASKGEMADRVS